MLRSWSPAPAARIEGLGPLPLAQEFIQGVPAFLRSDRKSRMSLLEQRYSLWARAVGTRVAVIARYLGYTDRGVRAFFARVKTDPGIFIHCRFVQKVSTGNTRRPFEWECLHCLRSFPDTASVCDHAWRHVGASGAPTGPLTSDSRLQWLVGGETGIKYPITLAFSTRSAVCHAQR